MIDPQKKAKNADRDAAIEVVEAAYADGQITQPDYELRVDRLLRAVTVGEVQMLVADLRRDPEEKVTDVVEAVTGETTTPSPPYRKVSTRSSTQTSSPKPPGTSTPRTGLWLAIGGIVVTIFVGLTVALPIWLTTRGSDGVAQGPLGLGREVSLLTPEGYDIFLDALEEKTGSYEAFSVVIYPGYAVVDVPVDSTSQRKFGWYFNGDWRESAGAGTSNDERFSADQIDGDVVARGIKRAKARVEEPTNWYVIVEAPNPDRDNACVAAYASNKFSESSYVLLRCDGSVIEQR